MSLFDPYSHTRLFELRQEQLSRKARRRDQLGAFPAADLPMAAIVRALSARLTRRPSATSARPSGRPALDS
jgi:hypothetical protein